MNRFVILLRKVIRRIRPKPRVMLPTPVHLDQSANESAPHYGNTLHELVRSTHESNVPRQYAAEYELIQDHFDLEYYLASNRHVATNGMDPIAHYIRVGAREGRDPTPGFSTNAYRNRYPEVVRSALTPFGHWVKTGRSKSFVAHPYTLPHFQTMSELLNMTEIETAQMLDDRRNDLRDRLASGKLGEMVKHAAQLEPLVALTWPKALEPRISPFGAPHMVSRLAVQYRLVEAAEFKRAKAIVLVNRPRWGGALRMEGHIAHALAKRYSANEILVISTDESGEMPEGKLPEGSRYVDFADIVGNLTDRIRQRVLLELIRSLRPEFVFNVNSRLYWDTLASYQSVLNEVTHSVGVFFCNEQTHLGYWTGYPLKLFYRHFDGLSAVCTDSEFLVSEFRQLYHVSPQEETKLHALPAPVDSSVELLPDEGSSGRPQVFWSGRFDRQKRLDLVYAIANRMPHVDFRMWGEPVLGSPVRLPPEPENVKLLGKYEKFNDLPLNEADLWLYTSEWDGVPALLLEVLMTGIPVVGSNSGGTGEIMHEDLSWLVDDIENVDAYCAAIEEVLADRSSARDKARRLRERLISERSRDAFEAVLFGMMDRILGEKT